jgi:hypothetical protein
VAAAVLAPAPRAASADGFWRSQQSINLSILSFAALAQLDKLPTFQYSRWVWLGTLVAAIYKGLSAQWLVAAYGLSAAWRLSQEQDLKQLAFLALAFWAFYKHVETPVALVLMGAQIVSSAIA